MEPDTTGDDGPQNANENDMDRLKEMLQEFCEESEGEMKGAFEVTVVSVRCGGCTFIHETECCTDTCRLGECRFVHDPNCCCTARNWCVIL